MMSDASSYDKDTGYYRGTPSPDTHSELSVSQQALPHQQGLVKVPWDDDNFSLCLDTFPSSRLARTKYNQYPTTASPLRKQWGSSSSCSSEHADTDDDEDVMRALSDTPIPGLLDNETRSTVSTTRQPNRVISSTTTTANTTTTTTLNRVTSKRDMVAGGIFPYKNNGNFLSRIDSAKKPTKIITQQQHPLQRNPNRVEHISPLSNSSIILQNENDIFNQHPSSPRPSLMHRTSNTSVRSKFSSHSALSHPATHTAAHRYFSSNDSQFSDSHSQYSDSSESWKLAQRRYGSAIVVMPSTPVLSHPIVSQHQQYQVHLTKSPSYLQYKKHQQDDAASVGSASVRYVGDSHRHSDLKYATPLQYGSSLASSVGFYTPQASPAPSTVSRGGNESVSSYRCIPVPRNADDLVLYSDDVTLAKNRDSTYSQVFDPAYNGKRKKSTRRKISSGIFTKLIKNLKQHFMKPTNKQQ